MSDEARAASYDELAVGDAASFTVTISESLVREFAGISGDRNPLHVDPAYASETSFKRPVAHGMIAGALFSRLVGMYLPGKYSLYLSQTLRFRAPIFPETEVTIRGKVIHKSDANKIVSVETIAEDAATKEVFVTGEAMVQLLK